ncbi:MAG: glutamyl-tRNA reductase, partial [Candidatus Lambdaproteobacteria bacterium]|nr:glutamyl-tRNA reductase [Candidatus Lambdaproteobacteria bacterium]
MNLCLLSLGYRTVPVELRERLALGEDHLPAVLAELRQTCGFSEAMVISTCNRVEFCFVAARPDRGFAALMTWLEERLGTEATASLDEAGIRFTHRSALAHLCRVACGLESMVLGEPQVFGQVKDAYRLAAEQGCAGPVLNGAMQRVFRVAKRVRTETGISRFAVSVSYAAVELGSRIFDTLSDKSVLVVGAGEMAELALAHLVKTGIGRLTLVNRTFANAVALA